MAFLEIPNVKIVGISAAVPQRKVRNREMEISSDYSSEDFIKSTGVEERRVTYTLTTSDLCYEAAERLIGDLHWKKEEIDAILFVSQTRDYLAPATSGILQYRLGLKTSTYCVDTTLGCSGWVYGLSNIASLMSNGMIKKALLMAGDSKTYPQLELSPIFGHAATVTALEYEEGVKTFQFHLGTDGSGYDAIIMPDRGSRNMITADSFKKELTEEGYRTRLQTRIKGLDVFGFGITTVPKSIKKLAEHYRFDYQDADYYLFHQANKAMLDMIVKKLKLPQEKVPYSLRCFGNTSSASIPLTMVTELKGKVEQGETKYMACGFGIGLSWGTISFSTQNLVVSNLVEVPES